MNDSTDHDSPQASRDAGATRMKMSQAAPRPCAQCPWRTANQGKRNAHGFYRKENLRRLWRGLRAGERMTCHPTDPMMAEFSGYENTAGRAVTRECAGALILTQRELVRFQAAGEQADKAHTKDALVRYRSAVGSRAMSAGGLAEIAWIALTAGRLSPAGLPMRAMNLNEPGIGVPDLPAWGSCPLDPPQASG
jgi:hypothetical protein